MNTVCTICGFNVRRYRVTVELDANANTFFCPVCGQSFDAVVEIPGKDVFYDEDSRAFVKWATSTEAQQAEVVVPYDDLDNFHLQVRAKTKDYQKLFYDAVIVFVLDGEIAQNQLFAPPESRQRYGLNITERILQSDNHLELQFELKGGARRYRTTLPAAVTRATTEAQAARVHNGSALTVWPNFKRPGWQEVKQRTDEEGRGQGLTDEESPMVEHGPWRDYFVSFGTTDDTLKVERLRVIGDAPGQEKRFTNPPLAGAMDFPPEYIEITANVTRTGMTGRRYQNCFNVDLHSYPPNEAGTHSRKLRLAIDFGTSNTCVCYLVPGSSEKGDAANNARVPRLLRLHNKNYEVVRGLPPGADVVRTWIPNLEGQDFVPSELVFQDEPQKVLANTARPQPVVDYTIPAARWRAGEEKKICTGFKWKHATEPASVREKYQDLQAMYLDMLLRLVVAELVSGDGPLAGADVHPNKVELVYTYPLAMAEERWRALGRVLESVGQLVHERTGVEVMVRVGVDESRAGEAGIKVQAEGERIFMDIGGGTTDIAVIEQRDDRASRELLLVDSIRYAGNDFLTALSDDAGGGHISTRPLIELQRRVRFFKRAALEDMSVFGSSEERKEEAQATLERFLEGVLQYLSRIIVLRLGSQAEGVKAPAKKLRLFLLGNGWNFILFLPRDPRANPNATPKDVMQEEVSRRLIKELERFRKGGFINLEPSTRWGDLFELHFPQEPKTAVALGALEVTRRPVGGLEKTFIGSDVEVVTVNGLQTFRWDTLLPHDLGVLIDRVSITNPIAGFEALRVPDYQYEHAPETNLVDIDIKRYVSDGRGRLVASAFNVYLERWYKNFLTGKWANNSRR